MFYTPLCLINDSLCLLIWLPLVINTVALFIKEEIQGSECKRVLVSTSPMFGCLIMSLRFTWRYHSVFNMDHGWYTIWMLNFIPLEFLYEFRIVLEKCHFSIPSVQSVSRIWLSIPWITAHQASLAITSSWSLLKLMSIESVMPSSHLILCCPLLFLLSILPSIRTFSHELVIHIRWPKFWSLSFSISPSNEYSGLISFRMDLLDLLEV